MATKLVYTHYSKAWYRDRELMVEAHMPLLDEIGVQRIAMDDNGRYDGTVWDFRIALYELGGVLTWRVKVWEDGWAAFVDVPQLFQELAPMRPLPDAVTIPGIPDLPTQDIIALLERHGFADTSECDDPYLNSRV
jgi:hypothetical protein